MKKIMIIRIQFAKIIVTLLLAAITCLSGCAITATDRVSAGRTWAESSDSLHTFKSACLLEAPADFCESLEKSFFKNSLPFQEFSSQDFMVSDYPTDAKTLFQKMYSPRHTTALAYCYFASRGSLDPKKLKPSHFARVIGGFAISSGELPAYEVWLKTENGLQCRQSVENSVGLSVIDLSLLLKNKLGLVALNPLCIASLADINIVTEAMKLTLNHERIHLLQANCPAIDDFAKEFWANLDPVKKAEFKKEIPGYNWDDQRVAVRESMAFTYENGPSLLLDKAKSCKF